MIRNINIVILLCKLETNQLEHLFAVFQQFSNPKKG